MINQKLIKLLKKIRNKRYQSVIISSGQAKEIKRSKIMILNNFKKNKKKGFRKIFFNQKDKTYSALKAIFNKKKLLNCDKKFIEKMYYKYNYNLNLKSKYNMKFKATTKKDTNIISYLYLGLLIKPNKRINYLQVLNMILKILDHVLINIKYVIQSNSQILVTKLINKEIFYLKKVKKKIYVKN
jgi:hypothetical protein